MQENAGCPVLEELLAEYRTPVVIEDDLLGELTLDKRYSTFEGTCVWRGNPVQLRLNVDIDSPPSWDRARNAARHLLLEQDEWDKEMRIFAAKQLTALANEWQAEIDAALPEMTERQFSERIVFGSLL